MQCIFYKPKFHRRLSLLCTTKQHRRLSLLYNTQKNIGGSASSTSIKLRYRRFNLLNVCIVCGRRMFSPSCVSNLMYMCVKVLYFGRFKPAYRGSSQWRPAPDAGARPKSEPAKKRNKGRKRKQWWAWKMGKGPKPKKCQQMMAEGAPRMAQVKLPHNRLQCCLLLHHCLLHQNCHQ